MRLPALSLAVVEIVLDGIDVADVRIALGVESWVQQSVGRTTKASARRTGKPPAWLRTAILRSTSNVRMPTRLIECYRKAASISSLRQSLPTA